jgi:mono/diheme cytochrome c family protein
MKIGRAITLAFATGVLFSSREPGRAGDTDSPPATVQFTNQSPAASLAAGRPLFLKNCAHCHGADAHGDDGPDLHALDVSDQWIANRIRNGKAGEMTAFNGKLQASEINALIAYLHTLK